MQKRPLLHVSHNHWRAIMPSHSNLQDRANLSKILEIHSEMLKTNSYCYFELAYTRYTEWMVWVCSNSRESDPNRKVLLTGQGSTPEEAAADAINNYEQQQGQSNE